MASSDTTKLLLIGKVGQGKSTLGNFIVKDPKTFETRPSFASSITGKAKKAQVDYEGKSYCVIDQPGLCDSEIEMSFGDDRPGVDAVLLVLSAAEQFGIEQEELIASLDHFHFWPYVIVVFTNADRLRSNDPDSKLKEILSDSRVSPVLKNLLEKTENRYVLLNATNMSEEYYKEKMEKIIEFADKIQSKQKKSYTFKLLTKAAEEIKSKKDLLEMNTKQLEEHKKDMELLKPAPNQEQDDWKKFKIDKVTYHFGGDRSMEIANNKLYSWGGNRRDIPLVHDSEEKRQITSTIDVLDIPTLSWSTFSTTGTPPAGVTGYSTAISRNGDCIYFFGSNCKPNCYHNDLLAFSTTTNGWSQLTSGDTASDSPMKKRGHGMVSFTGSDNEEYLLVIGGVGPTPTTVPTHVHLQYTPHPSKPNRSYTSEAHIICTSSQSGCSQWAVPTVTGTPPPPTAWFTINRIPNENAAVMFGGNTSACRTKSIYHLTFTKHTLDYKRLTSPSPISPKERDRHSSTLITPNTLLVMGGLEGYKTVISDCWLFHINEKTWKRIYVPDSASKRCGHSVSSYTVSDNCVWVVVTGGYTSDDKDTVLITGADVTMIMELVQYHSGDWTVSNVWNSSQLISEKDSIVSRLTNPPIPTLSSVSARGSSQSDVVTKCQSCKKLERVYECRIEGYVNLLREQKKQLHEQEKQLHEKDQILASFYLKQSKELSRKRKNDYESRVEGFINFLHEQKKQIHEQDQMLDSFYELSRKIKNDTADELECKQLKEDASDEVEMYLDDKKEILEENEKASQSLLVSKELIKVSGLVQRVDASVQFSWVDVKTDHLQSMTVFRSKYFHIHGEQAHHLIWEGFGFELHLPEHTFLPTEECCIKVDAVIGGDFVIPEGVEPVSAIYVISVTTKLRQRSLLKIQHCVDLSRTHPDNELSFYRASLKESSPPYHFKRVPGGRFDVFNKYGELELPVFCAQVIGKDKEPSQASEEVSSDKQSMEDSHTFATSYSSGFSDGNSSLVSEPTADDSIMYHCQLFYLQQDLSEWEALFVVAKNLDAFDQYIRANLSSYKLDEDINVISNELYIELVFSADSSEFKGWTILKHKDPCSLSLKRANSFGYEKDVTNPPSCMLTVYVDTSVTEYQKRLHYPLTLKGCLSGIDMQPAVIFLNRKITEGRKAQGKEEMISQSIQPVTQQQTCPVQKVDHIVRCIKEVFDKSFPKLKGLFENSLEHIAAEMLGVGLIPHHVANSPSFDAIIQGFYSGFSFLEDMEEIKDWCGKFFSSMRAVGGAFNVAAEKLERQLRIGLGDKFGLDF